MSQSIILDHEGMLTSMDGHRVIESEVDFLRFADSNESLLIKGRHLCTWAAVFYKGRKIAFEERRSPAVEIMDACPGVSRDEANTVYQYLKDVYWGFPQPVTASTMMNHEYPIRLWHDSPSYDHASRWLNFLIEVDVTPALQPVLGYLSRKWQKGSSRYESRLYTATSRDEAKEMILGWLGVKKMPEYEQLDPYPGPMVTVEQDIQELWEHKLIETHGKGIFRILSTPGLHDELSTRAASLAVKYFQRNSENLTGEIYRVLRPHLDGSAQKLLQRFVPPSPPSVLPPEPTDVLNWYREDYLPYRLWQYKYGNDDAVEIVQTAFGEFASWYLDNYPKAIMGGPLSPFLSYMKAAQLSHPSETTADYVTLVIVLDGLYLEDAHTVLDGLERSTSRLTMAQNTLTFVPLPTVTEFCKDALFKGTPPIQAKQYETLGLILPEKQSPVSDLDGAESGSLFWWRVQEPDATYHKRNNHDMLFQDVQSELGGIVQKIVDIINQVSISVSLRIILTSDHGRFVGMSERTLPVPAGMESHGRAAWGRIDRAFPGSGYIKEDGIVYLHGDRFGLPVDAAISLSDAAFHTNDGKRGQEIFAHGGLTPEEVIVPWWVFVRDVEKPKLTVTLSGSGLARARSDSLLSVINASEITVHITALRLLSRRDKREFDLDITCDPKYKKEITVSIDTWPTSDELAEMTGEITYRMPNGRDFTTTMDLSLQSEEMYRSDNILDDLGLP